MSREEKNKKRKSRQKRLFLFYGADNRIRTGDLILTKDVLYLLSHISECSNIISKLFAFVNGFYDFYFLILKIL